jgi:hypothetical protein
MKKANLGKVDLDAGVVLGCQNPVTGATLPVQNILILITVVDILIA